METVVACRFRGKFAPKITTNGIILLNFIQPPAGLEVFEGSECNG